MNLVKKAKDFIEGQRNIKITLQFDELSAVTIKLRSEKREKNQLKECTNPFKKKIETRLKDVEIDDEALTELEKNIFEDLEETIQEKLLDFSN